MLEKKAVPGATAARALAEDPHRFLPTVQVGITLVSVLTRVLGGANVAAALEGVVEPFPAIGPLRRQAFARDDRDRTWYLTLVLGELVPKQLALRKPEFIATWVARP